MTPQATRPGEALVGAVPVPLLASSAAILRRRFWARQIAAPAGVPALGQGRSVASSSTGGPGPPSPACAERSSTGSRAGITATAALLPRLAHPRPIGSPYPPKSQQRHPSGMINATNLSVRPRQLQPGRNAPDGHRTYTAKSWSHHRRQQQAASSPGRALSYGLAYSWRCAEPPSRSLIVSAAASTSLCVRSDSARAAANSSPTIGKFGSAGLRRARPAPVNLVPRSTKIPRASVWSASSSRVISISAVSVICGLLRASEIRRSYQRFTAPPAQINRARGPGEASISALSRQGSGRGC